MTPRHTMGWVHVCFQILGLDCPKQSPACKLPNILPILILYAAGLRATTGSFEGNANKSDGLKCHLEGTPYDTLYKEQLNPLNGNTACTCLYHKYIVYAIYMYVITCLSHSSTKCIYMLRRNTWIRSFVKVRKQHDGPSF